MSLRDLPEVSQETPAFGQADLSNCERELIHLAGSIQPHGALLVVHEPDLVITQASANAQKFLGSEESLVGQPLRALSVDLHERVERFLDSLSHIPVPVRARVGGHAYDLLLHRPPSGGLVVELERASPSFSEAAPPMPSGATEASWSPPTPSSWPSPPRRSSGSGGGRRTGRGRRPRSR